MTATEHRGADAAQRQLSRIPPAVEGCFYPPRKRRASITGGRAVDSLNLPLHRQPAPAHEMTAATAVQDFRPTRATVARPPRELS